MKHRHIVPAVFAERPNCFPAGVQKMVYITTNAVEEAGSRFRLPA